MKKYNTFLYIHPLTIIYVILSLLVGKFSFVIALFIISLMHELFHVFGAMAFNLRIEEITIHPIGCYAKIFDTYKARRIVQLIIFILGPISYFFTSAILMFFFRSNIVSYDLFNELNEINLFMLLFNLLPLEPLDGGRIIKLIISSLVDEKSAIIINALIGLLTSIFITFLLVKMGQFVFLIFVIYYAINNVIQINKNYNTFILKRFINKDYMNYKIKINKNMRIHQYSNNYYLNKNKIVDEKEILSEMINKQIKNIF